MIANPEIFQTKFELRFVECDGRRVLQFRQLELQEVRSKGGIDEAHVYRFGEWADVPLE